MDCKQIPGTDLTVSRACLRTMTIGAQVDEAATAEALACAIARSVNFVDTANIYPPANPTAAEQILGKILKPWRRRVILASKAGGPVGPGPGDRGLGKRHLTQAVEDSLRRLQTDCLDLCCARFPDLTVTPEELLEAMNALIQAGKIRFYGISNFSACQTCELLLKAREMGLQPPAATENVYNLLTRDMEPELLPLLRKYPMGLITFTP